ncbi:hypothetical protein M513_09856 [Trichuris suis]|uniref:Uncharacterized protein n=1 Tax=Trichuris suis TaxID=68888 RepID=A0A085LWF8_9BILA|nr:hypothetical protein M513_14377 [Trichuris suis]KFD45374.1 hypothetical protein M513_13749 [Trichuris suis]KFD49304.1 hypothetical protein M513_09856 [Trichuris suis]
MKNPLFVLFNLITAMIITLAKCTGLAAFLQGTNEEGCLVTRRGEKQKAQTGRKSTGVPDEALHPEADRL